jgi:hypothetical protein
MKVAILILSTTNEPSTSNVAAMKETFISYCDKNPDKFKHEYTFFEYYGILDNDSDVDDMIFSSDEVIKESNNFYKIELASEDGIHKTFEKTVSAFEKVDSLDKYDWFVRINISTYLNVPLLDKILGYLDNTMIYSSALNTYITDEKYFNDIYPRGDFYMFSKYTYDKISKYFSKYVFDIKNFRNMFNNTVPHVDDCVLGLCIIEGLGNNYYEKLKTLTYNFLPRDTDISGFNKYALASRVKTMPPGVNYSGYSWDDNKYRRCDAEKIKRIHEVVTSTNYASMTPGVFNSQILLADDSPSSRPTLLIQMSNQHISTIKAHIKRKRG